MLDIVFTLVILQISKRYKSKATCVYNVKFTNQNANYSVTKTNPICLRNENLFVPL